MRAKVLKPKGPSHGQGATDSCPQPGDFPLGSPESRAAARARVQRRTTLSPYDEDCLVLCLFSSQLSGHADPDSRCVTNTEFYKRGWEIRDGLYGPIIPSHLDPEYPRRTFASIDFEAIHGRVPQPGDILRYEDLADLYSEEMLKTQVGMIQGAWARRLPDTPCPFKYEDGKMLIHQDDGTWKAEEGAVGKWSRIEDEAFGREFSFYPPRVVPEQPTIRAVVFIESKDKKRRVKPLEENADTP